MPRENSFSDSDGRSLTPDLEDELRRERNGNISPLPAPLSPVKSRESHVHKLFNPLSPTRTHKASIAPDPWSNLTPKERFRALVRKVMFLNRGTSILASGGGEIGAEPGINPRRATAELLYGHIYQRCTIEIMDYSAVRSSVGRMTNEDFIGLMRDPVASAREPWVKVRWINIGGMSWDVIKAVSIKYDLHPLALEDVFHIRSQNRSKADYYPKHLFLRVLCHELAKQEEPPDSSSTSASQLLSVLPGAYRSASPDPFAAGGVDKIDGVQEDEDGMSETMTPRKRKRFLPLRSSTQRDVEAVIGNERNSQSSFARLLGRRNLADRERKAEQVTLDTLKQGERVNVKVSPMFVFLLREGVVITLHSAPDLNFTSPISKRLYQRDTGLRASADPSFLVHALLDLVVDNALEVIDEYHGMINKFEHNILLKPSVETVRHIHILSGDLILHKRTLEPIKTLVYGLRRYDVDRCAALIDSSDPANADVKVVGFMSHKAKIYLADVNDHMDYILTSLDMYASIAENLISYTFNLTSYEMNEVMRRLTLATIICLPLTLLTGYFGMNFVDQWSVQHNSDLFFWELAIPIMIVIIPLFTLPELKRMIHYLKTKMSTRQAMKTLKTE